MIGKIDQHDVMFLAGLALAGSGLAWIHPAAVLVAAGAAVSYLGYRGATRGTANGPAKPPA